ncbi:MAG: DUF1343 domain-containing protein [Myxococcales bacterium]|nr:DUF1343 domain-containing protein [Myxococcales bacterium]
MSGMKVLTGLDLMVSDGFASLKGQRVGLLAHPASVDGQLRHILPLMVEAGVDLQALFGPEHGLEGAAQDMETVTEQSSGEPSGVKVYSLYGSDEASLRPSPEMFSGLDVVVVDLQDIGARYYTYAASMGYVMQTAARTGTRVLVLDRPNPLGGRDEDVEGPGLYPQFVSFVGAFNMPIRHSLTLAEYAAWIRKKEAIDVELELVPMKGWSRTMDFEATGLPWIMPSPNMPTNDAAWVYPGQCLLEGTNLSEGRGTTRPFEQCGAPWLDGRAWAETASQDVGDGVRLRPLLLKPMFQKHANRYCGGVQIHVVDRWTIRSLRVSLALLHAARRLAPQDFGWRVEAYEFVSDRLAIDLLFGSDQPRSLLEGGASVADILETFREDEAAFVEERQPVLMY